MPQKKYLVDLTELEKLELEKLLKSGKHQFRKLTRARILLLANDGKTDTEIVEVLQTARPTVERTRKRFVEEGLDCLREKLRHGARPRLDERGQAHLIAVACSPAPEGYARRTWQLLADKAVELGLVDSIAKETIRQALKKTNSSCGSRSRAVSVN